MDDLFDIEPIPALPPDLKAKKVNLKEAKKLAKEKDSPEAGTKSLLEEIEDNLYDEGLIDLEEDPWEDDI